MKKLSLLTPAVFAVITILLTACSSAPQNVVNSWVAALNKGDIEAALSYLAEDAVVTISPAGPEGDAVFTGHAEIRGWYETLAAGKGITTLTDCKVDRETITCLDTYADEGLQSMGVDFIEGSWVAVVRDGKIQSYIFTASPESLAKLVPPPNESKPASPEPANNFPIGMFINKGWGWEFKADGSYIVQGLGATELGTFTVNGDQISVKGDYCGDVIGLYTWTYDGATLTFKAIDDQCPDRVGTVVAGNGQWTKRP
jgi:hypothetical protein